MMLMNDIVSSHLISMVSLEMNVVTRVSDLLQEVVEIIDLLFVVQKVRPRIDLLKTE